MKKQTILYSFLFALYPILALLASNISQIEISNVFRPIAFVLLINILLLFISKVFLKNWDKASLLTSLIIGLIFTYGHIYLAIEQKSLGGIIVGRHRFLIPIWILLFIIGLILIIRLKSDAKKLRSPLNAISTVLLIMPLITMASHFYSQFKYHQLDSQNTIISQNLNPQSLPDVYYIVLDSYARQDVLEILYEFDNNPFLEDLEDLGFFIARESTSNYPNTALSVSSALNMDYIQNFEGFPFGNGNIVSPLYTKIKDSTVHQTFDQLGYSSITFRTGYSGTEIKNSDYYLKSQPKDSDIFAPPNVFEGFIIKTSALRILYEFSSFFPEWLQPDLSDSFEKHRDRIVFGLDQLVDLPQTDSPKFVFLHLVSPHAPYVFGPNGELLPSSGPLTLNSTDVYSNRDVYIEGYLNQVRYLNDRLLETVNYLITNSEAPPIIVLQSDHGPGASIIGESPSPISYQYEKLSNLNLLYLPNCNAQISPNITPVNTFRLIFSECFSLDIELIEDKVYFSNYITPYELREVNPKTFGK